jgi:lipopolysaccharide export system permease protein
MTVTRKFLFVFRIVDRYVLRQILVPLAAALLISLLMLLAGRMLGFLDITLGKKNSFTAVFKMLAYLTPNYLGLAVPAALYIGILFGFNRMSKTHELDAMLASGIGLNRLFRPVLVLSFLLMLCNLIAIGWMQPYGRYSYRSVIYTLTNVDTFDLAREGIFMKAGPRTFIVDRLSQSENKFDHLFIFEDRGPAQGSETVTANSGRLINGSGQAAPVLRMEVSKRLRLNSYPDFASAEVPQTAITADTQSADFPLDQVAASVFRPRGTDERELTIWELLQRQDNPPKGSSLNLMKSELHNRILKIIAIPMLAILALPFALSRGRNPDAYRFGIAILLLIIFNVVIEQGTLATSLSGISPWVSMWGPFLLYLGFALWRFWLACFKLNADATNPISEFVAWISSLLRRRILT